MSEKIRGIRIKQSDGSYSAQIPFAADMSVVDGKADKTATVSMVAYDSTNKKITKTINGTTTDVVTLNTIKNDLGSMPASDVAAWAKEPNKPTYTANEVGAIPASEKGAANGVAPLNVNQKVAANYIGLAEWTKTPNKPTYTADEVGAIPTTKRGAPNGVAPLDANQKVSAGYLDLADWAKAAEKPEYTAEEVEAIPAVEKGVANGVVPLDPSKKILPEYLPDSIMAGLTYGGIFNATTRVVELTPAAKSILDVSSDTMTLEDSSRIPEGYPANAELFYITTTGGTFAGMTFANGDWLISLGTSWKQLQSGNQVSSVNAKTGAVVLNTDDIQQGLVNFYMRSTERAKLADIETRATKDVNVIQSASIGTDANNNEFLHLSNKNGTTVDFYGTIETDLVKSASVLTDSSDNEFLRLINKNGQTTDFHGDSNVVQSATVLTDASNNEFLRLVNKNGTTTDFQGGTNDTDVVKTATVFVDAQNNKFLRLVNKNGTTTDFYGNLVDLTDYLTKDGDGSNVSVSYTPESSRQVFSGGETLQQFAAKAVGWFNAIKKIAFTNNYEDLDNRPTYNSVDIEGALEAEDLGTLDVREVNNALPDSPRANTLYILHTEKRGEPWTRYYIYINNEWREIETGGFEVIGINTDPETTPPTADAIYVHHWLDTSDVTHTQIGVMLDGTYNRLALTQDIITDYNNLDNTPSIDGKPVEGRNQTHESLGLVGVDDFVQTATGKTSGIEIVLPDATPSSPIVITNINDADELEYSTVHTSSNNKINRHFDSIEQALVGKLNLEFVDEMPDPPARNTQYYVATDVPGVWEIHVVDAVGTVQDLGTTAIDTSSFVSITRRVAGIPLDADIAAAQVADAIKASEVQLSNKIISADDNQLTDIVTDNMKPAALATSINTSAPLDTKLATEKAVNDFAVQKTTAVSKIYGTSSTGTANNYSLVTSVSNASTDAQIPTAKSIYSYAVPKTTDANKVYGSSNNFNRVTSISSSSTDTQLPTAKAVYNFAVAKTSTADRIYGTNSSGGANLMGFSGTYTSTANNQLFTRAGAYNLYTAVRNGEQSIVFCGNFTRNSTQSVSSNTSTRVPLTSADIYRTNLVSLTSNNIKVLVAGTYLFRFIGRLADTTGATRAWYLGGGSASSMADDQMGGMWSYTYNRHKAEATYLKYCATNESISPWVYIDSNTGTLNYMTVEVFRLNNK